MNTTRRLVVSVVLAALLASGLAAAPARPAAAAEPSGVRAGQAEGGIASWSAAFGPRATNDQVRAAAVDGSGNLYVGGYFTTAGGAVAHGVARWDGTIWSALGTPGNEGTDGTVYALAVYGTTVYVGGDFGTAGGVPVSDVAKWDGSTNTWSALGSGTNNIVLALAVDGSGNLYAGGQFTTAGGITVNYVAKWNGAAWSALGTSPNQGTNALVEALATSGSDVYAGGQFTTAGGAAANYIAKWNANNNTWSNLGSGMGGTAPYVNALAVSGSNLYAGGLFTTAGGGGANYVARWNGSTWSALGSGTNATVLALALDGSGNLYAGGDFTTAGGGGANYVARWDGAVWSALGTLPDGTDATVWALALYGSNLYAGGDFLTAGTAAANYVALWDGSAWSGMGGQGMDDWVLALAGDGGGHVYAGGTFLTAGATIAPRLARWDGSTWNDLGCDLGGTVDAVAVDGSGNVYAGGTDPSGTGFVFEWNGSTCVPLGPLPGVPPHNGVHALLVDGNGTLYAGGAFDFVVPGPPYPDYWVGYVAYWDTVVSAWVQLGVPYVDFYDGTVLVLAVDSTGTLFAGGGFSNAPAYDFIAQWNGFSWVAVGAPGTLGMVRALAVDGADNLYAGGVFGVPPLSNIAMWNGAAWSALANGLDWDVNALAADGCDNLYAGGEFTAAIGGPPVRHVALWNGTAWSPLGTPPNDGTDLRGWALAVEGDKLYAGGEFGLAGGAPANYVAEWTIAMPQIEVDPASFHAEQCPDKVTQQSLNICNVGDADLAWSLSEAAPKAGAAVPAAPKVTLPEGAPQSLAEWLALGKPSFQVQPVAPSLPAAPEGLTFYSDRGAFDADYPALPQEGYENGSMPSASVNAIPHPLDQYSSNAYFDPGDIMAGIQFWASASHSGDELAALGDNFLYNPTKTVAANYFADSYVILLDPPVLATGMDLQEYLGNYSCQVDVYDTNGYAGSATSGCNEAGIFWGVASNGSPITQLVITSLGGGAEGADNVVFSWAPFDASWLSESPTSGTLQPGECAEVAVTFDSTGLAAGDYFANLVVDSNDPDDPTVTLPVQLTVLECPANTMHIGDIRFYLALDPYGRTQAIWYVLAHDGIHNPLGVVRVDATIWDPGGIQYNRTRITKWNGWARFHWGHPLSSPFLMCVDKLTLPGYTYVPEDNDVPNCVGN